MHYALAGPTRGGTIFAGRTMLFFRE